MNVWAWWECIFGTVWLIAENGVFLRDRFIIFVYVIAKGSGSLFDLGYLIIEFLISKNCQSD